MPLLTLGSKGDIAEAERHARAQVRKDVEGDDFPLNAPLTSFRVFGAGVNAYMIFVHRAAGLFFFCFLLSLSNLLSNFRGNVLEADTEVSMKTLVLQTTLHNSDQLGVPKALIEAVIAGLMVRFLFVSRWEQLREADEVRQSQVTPSDFSVMLSGFSADGHDAGDVKEMIETIDPLLQDIVLVTMSVECQDLVQLARERTQLCTAEHSLLARRYLLRRDLRRAREQIGHDLPSISPAKYSRTFDRLPSTGSSASAEDTPRKKRRSLFINNVTDPMEQPNSHVSSGRSSGDASEPATPARLKRRSLFFNDVMDSIEQPDSPASCGPSSGNTSGATTPARPRSPLPFLQRVRTNSLLARVRKSFASPTSLSRYELLRDEEGGSPVQDKALRARRAHLKEHDSMIRKLARIQDDLDVATKKLQANSAKCAALARLTPRCTGVAFVTFQHEAAAQRLLASTEALHIQGPHGMRSARARGSLLGPSSAPKFDTLSPAVRIIFAAHRPRARGYHSRRLCTRLLRA